jgi:hypothetical protein
VEFALLPNPKSRMPKKEYNIPLQRKIPLFLFIKFMWHIYYNIFIDKLQVIMAKNNLGTAACA